MKDLISKWGEAAYTSVGFFWMALWAFILGYLISSIIQVFVTEARMQKAMGRSGKKDILLGTFFGFISSSCSFSALATTRSIFQKGASFISSIAFLLASTNLVIELGIIISIFMGWQFLVGEYVGGILLILFSYILVRIIKPDKLVAAARNKLDDNTQDDELPAKQKLFSAESWAKVAKQFNMEWQMVWKDVTIGFTIAGIIAAFVPDEFFRTLFINSGKTGGDYSFFTLLEHVLVGPVAAFFTFIGSMGNIPLAALLYGKGVSFAGVMAFIFSDLVVLPVLRINAKYYGWKMSLFILFLLFVSLVISSLLLHYGLDIFHLLPHSGAVTIMQKEYFQLNYTFFLNIAFAVVVLALVFLPGHKGEQHKVNHMHHHNKSSTTDTILKWLAITCMVWLITGMVLKYTI
ncbi:MAG: permease [Chitinophagaceae bacterium]|nr:permease [Chitinophagaceae bacterium]MCB9045205.1 permease [Chitinophagales bacterium]